ncbi:XRE family transcriptional regulator [Staphylococcus aureus]|uniref:spr1629 family repressor/antitoxin n=1 Tax=Staphylococcus aureus TaxID=1280 RepID=UPI0030F3F826
MFIGKNLEYVRKLNALSRKELSEKINVSEQAIWQYETKNMMPEINKIYDMTSIFNVKSSYFISEQPEELLINSVDKHSIAFRAKNYKVSTKLLNKQYYQAMYLSNLTNYLFSFVKIPDNIILSLINNLDDLLNGNLESLNKKESIKETAKVVRAKILQDESNEALLFMLEKAGIVIYEKRINDSIDAYSFWSKDQTPFIILGTNKGVAVRRNFDLAHELGHLVLHRHIQFDLLSPEEYKTIEHEADIFASEFLLPEEAFKKDFDQMTKKSNPDYLAVLKEKWYVSIQAIAMRAYYLGLMSSTQYRYFWASLNKKDYKSKEPLDDVIEMSRPVKMNSLLKLYFDRNILTPQKLLNYLKVDETFLNHLAGINLKLFKDYVNENREYNITNLYK